MNKPVVWVVKEQVVRGAVGSNAMDYSPAMVYGDIQFITRSDMPLHPASTVRALWDEDVEDFVKKYDEERDYIITTGQPTAIFAVGHALGLEGKNPRYLVWRREEGEYRVLENSVTQ